MSTCSILIIDDDTDDVEILTEALNKSGVERVHRVYTAMEAFMYLERIPHKEDLPCLIITDMYLPGIRGDQFLLDLKGMPQYGHIPVVVLSTSKSPSEIERYRQMGAVDYLIKPGTYAEYLDVAKGIAQRVLE